MQCTCSVCAIYLVPWCSTSINACRIYPPAYGAAVAAAHVTNPLSANDAIPTAAPAAPAAPAALTDREAFELMLLDPPCALCTLVGDLSCCISMFPVHQLHFFAAEALVADVCRYLRGNRHVAIPDSWYLTVNPAVSLLPSRQYSYTTYSLASITSMTCGQ